VSGPDRTRSNTNGLYLFVNGRPVRDPSMRHAVLESYRDLLPKGRYPTAVVFLTLPPTAVDVNVHPAKWEVRFSESQAVHRLVRHAIREAMTSRHWLDGGRAALTRGTMPRPGPRSGEGRNEVPAATPQDWIFSSGASGVDSPATNECHAQSPSLLRDGAAAGAPASPAAGEFSGESAERLRFGKLRLLGQMGASYLVLEGPDGMLLVDQHAAHERVLYEDLRSGWLEQGVERQGLLAPVHCELHALEHAALMAAQETVLALGFEIESFGESSVVVRALPALLSDRNPAELIRGLAEELQKGAGETTPEADPDRTRLLAAADRVFATLACHSARRFGDHLETEEQEAILRGLDRIPWAPTCPHGRPVAIAMGIYEIERRFGRR